MNWKALPRKKSHRVAAIAVSLVLVGLVLKAALPRHSPPADEAATPASQAEGSVGQRIALPPTVLDKNPVETVTVSKLAPTEEIFLPGRVETDPAGTAIVGARTKGRIVQVLVNEGDRVKRGQTLAVLQSAELGQAESDHLKALARFSAKKTEMDRVEQLFRSEIVSAKEHETATMEFKSAASEIEASRVLLRSLGASEADIRRCENGKTQAGTLILYSPIAGTVMERKALIGQTVSAEDELFRVGDFSKLWVVLAVYEREAAMVREGSRAEVYAVSDRGASAPGTRDAQKQPLASARVARVARFFDSETRAAEVRLELENVSGKLVPGQAVSARIEGIVMGAGHEQVRAVPAEAVHAIEGKDTVFLRRGPHEYESRQVEAGWRSDRWVEVRSGVEVGDEIASKGSFILKSELLRTR